MTTLSRKPRSYLPTLDGWRAIAIIGVLFHHSLPVPHLRALKTYGWLGVDLFFAISGLLICSRLLDEESLQQKISIKNFYIRRALRILPPAYFYLVVIAILAGLKVLPFDLTTWLGAAFFYRNYLSYAFHITSANWFTNHFWSLSVEEHFYIVLPFILVLFPRRRGQIMSGLIVALFIVLCAFAVYHHGIANEEWDRRTELRLLCLFIPALIAIKLQRDGFRQSLTKWLKPWVGALLTFLALSTSFLLRSLSVFALPGEKVVNPVMLLATSIAFPMLVLSTVLNPNSLLGRILESSSLRSIGRLSYSIYLWQELFLGSDTYLNRLPLQGLQKTGLSVVLTLLCASGSYFLLEKPFMRLAHRIARPATPGRPNL